MTPIFIYDLLIGGINVSDFHIVVFFSVLLYTNRSFFDETDTEQIQIQTCGNSTSRVSQTHKIGNIGIVANFVCSFLLYFATYDVSKFIQN